MVGISLTGPMRSTLLSLRNISGLRDVVSDRLATGLKVNSALDNPSSFYTALSLSDRAADLNSLLDAMSQGVQSLKNASQTIETAVNFLQQASALAGQALEASSVPAKEWFEEQVGDRGVVVTTSEELKTALAGGKETIVVYGRIILNDETLKFKPGQKLVGTEYFTGMTGRERFSCLEINISNNKSGIDTRYASELSDLDIFFNESGESSSSAILISSDGDPCVIRNINLNCSFASPKTHQFAALNVRNTYGGASGVLEGQINVSYTSSKENIRVFGIYNDNGNLNISPGTKINIKGAGRGLLNYGRTTIGAGSELNILGASTAVLNGYDLYDSSNQILTIESGVKIRAVSDILFHLRGSTDKTEKIIGIQPGVEISWASSEGTSQGTWLTTGIWRRKSGGEEYLTGDSLNKDAGEGKFRRISDKAEKFPDQLPEENNLKQYAGRYNELLKQYDSLIGDSGYKGINLLRNGRMKVVFNEDTASKLEIFGIDASSAALGLETAVWGTMSDIAASVAEISSALGKIRGYTSQFGAYYNILTTRYDFSQAMIAVLEEGADKLVLADMNRESADMLTLRTRQMLAVNALSLTARAGRSVLALF